MTYEHYAVACFSAGVSSAVATKLALSDGYIDEVIYTHIEDQHEDSMRFVLDCEKWFGRKITILQSPLKNVDNACRSAAYINSPHGAACTKRLKRMVREGWEKSNQHRLKVVCGHVGLCYAWGMDCSENEVSRSEKLIEAMPNYLHRFPLIERHISKEQAHQMLKVAGIKRPAMYDLGYENNNCVGCVKGGAGYWNKIRVDFPEVFEKRSELERLIGARMNNRYSLEDLDPGIGNGPEEINNDCGLFCDLDEYKINSPP